MPVTHQPSPTGHSPVDDIGCPELLAVGPWRFESRLPRQAVIFEWESNCLPASATGVPNVKADGSRRSMIGVEGPHAEYWAARSRDRLRHGPAAAALYRVVVGDYGHPVQIWNPLHVILRLSKGNSSAAPRRTRTSSGAVRTSSLRSSRILTARSASFCASATSAMRSGSPSFRYAFDMPVERRKRRGGLARPAPDRAARSQRSTARTAPAASRQVRRP